MEFNDILLLIVGLLTDIFYFIFIFRLAKLVVGNQTLFTKYAKINDEKVQQIQNDLVPLYHFKLQNDLYYAEEEERYEDCRKNEKNLEALEQYAKQNNITL